MTEASNDSTIHTHALEYECKECGAPMGACTLSAERYAKSPGFETNGFTSHSDDELITCEGFTQQELDQIQYVKLVARTCRSCRAYEY